MKKQINKLVRDHIPSFCKNPETRILNDEDYTAALKQKLNEEVGEYLQDNTIEELAANALPLSSRNSSLP